MLTGGFERIIQKCTQRNPEDRYQSCAELMYALEHYDEIDDIYRKKQKKKVAAFVSCATLTILSAAVAGWAYFSAENKKSENYDNILKAAEGYEDYYNAILTDPNRTEAYLQLNNNMIQDFVLSKEEAQKLLKLQIGLEKKDKQGFTEKQDVLQQLKNNNPQGYQEVCYEIGTSFLFYYDVNVDRDRYVSAEKWFKESTEEYPISQIYCDISTCLDAIDQYSGAKVKQTDKMYESYDQLWKEVQELKQKTDQFDDIDARLQVWTEINKMVNAQVVPFLEVTSGEEMKTLLKEISDEAGKVSKSVIAEDIKGLQSAIQETISKIETAQKGAGKA
mgnify:FL=1